MKSILITGGLGFVGSNIAKKLSEKYFVTVVDNLTFGNRKNKFEDISYLIMDFENLKPNFINTFDILIHCATVNINYATIDPIETFKVNALNTIDLFTRFKGHIIYTSTASVYGNADVLPTPETAKLNVYNAYDQSKLIAEKFLMLRGNYNILRLSNVFGENQRPDNPYCGVVGRFIYDLMTGDKVNVFGNGMATRDYTYVGDVVRAVEMVIERGSENMTYNVSGGNEISTFNLAKKIALMLYEETHKDFYIGYKPNRAIDKINRRLLDSTLIRNSLGWRPETSFDDGLKNTIEWMKKYIEDENKCLLSHPYGL